MLPFAQHTLSKIKNERDDERKTQAPVKKKSKVCRASTSVRSHLACKRPLEARYDEVGEDNDSDIGDRALLSLIKILRSKDHATS